VPRSRETGRQARSATGPPAGAGDAKTDGHRGQGKTTVMLQGWFAGLNPRPGPEGRVHRLFRIQGPQEEGAGANRPFPGRRFFGFFFEFGRRDGRGRVGRRTIPVTGARDHGWPGHLGARRGPNSFGLKHPPAVRAVGQPRSFHGGTRRLMDHAGYVFTAKADVPPRSPTRFGRVFPGGGEFRHHDEAFERRLDALGRPGHVPLFPVWLLVGTRPGRHTRYWSLLGRGSFKEGDARPRPTFSRGQNLGGLFRGDDSGGRAVSEVTGF